MRSARESFRPGATELPNEVWDAKDARDRRNVADEIEIELVEKCRTDRVRGNDIEERVAVRRCPHRSFGADIAACARSILDDEPLTEPIRYPLTHQARDDIWRAAGRIWDDDAHRPRRISLRESDARGDRQRSGARGQMQEFAAGKFHFKSSLCDLFIRS